MTSPFDDPEFREQMARMGVAHKPGMAADMMQQLAPLLAAEGIDMDDPETLPDLDTVNAALDRATAQHNFMLASPIDAQRAQALSLLRDVALALRGEDDERAASLLATIESEPSGEAPSVAHVIGVALGLLDTWHSDPTISVHLTRTRMPRWHNGPSRKAGTDIHGLAKKGRAFDSMDGLIRRHAGFSVFEGAALAVAGSIFAWAASEGVETEVLLDRVVSDTSYRAPSGSSFRRPSAPSASAPSDLQRGFRVWLEDAAPDIGAPTVNDEAKMFASLLRIADVLSLDLSAADDAAIVFDELLEQGEDSPIEPALLTLRDFTQFQIETSDNPDGWEALYDEIATELDGPPPVLAAIEAAVAGDAEIPETEKRSILDQMLLVTAVGPLLEWVGKGRPVTATGNVRRADISAVAALLGITAVGVAKSPLPDDEEFARAMAGEEPKQFNAKSMSDVPMVSEWWEALRACDVIVVTGSRVKPGPAASAWIDDSIELVDLQMLVSVFISELIAGPTALSRLGIARAASLLQELGELIDPDVPGDADDDDQRRDLMRALSFRTITRLPRLGIGEVDADDAVSLPRSVRGTVAKGMLIAMAILRESLE